MHVFPATAPIRFFPFGKVRIPQVIFFVLYIEVSISLRFLAHSRPRAEGGGVPLGEVPPNAPLVGAARLGRRAR